MFYSFVIFLLVKLLRFEFLFFKILFHAVRFIEYKSNESVTPVFCGLFIAIFLNFDDVVVTIVKSGKSKIHQLKKAPIIVSVNSFTPLM